MTGNVISTKTTGWHKWLFKAASLYCFAVLFCFFCIGHLLNIFVAWDAEHSFPNSVVWATTFHKEPIFLYANVKDSLTVIEKCELQQFANNLHRRRLDTERETERCKIKPAQLKNWKKNHNLEKQQSIRNRKCWVKMTQICDRGNQNGSDWFTDKCYMGKFSETLTQSPAIKHKYHILDNK